MKKMLKLNALILVFVIFICLSPVFALENNPHISSDDVSELLQIQSAENIAVSTSIVGNNEPVRAYSLLETALDTSFSVSLNKGKLMEGLITANVIAKKQTAGAINVKTFVVMYNASNQLKDYKSFSNVVNGSATTSYKVETNIDFYSQTDILKIFIWDDDNFNFLNPVCSPITLTTSDAIYSDDFLNVNTGTRLNTTNAISNWKAKQILEPNYTTYTPSLGAKLYSEVATVPTTSTKGIRLYDDVGRTTSATNGAGALGVYHPIPEINSDYTIKFKLYAPNAGSYGGFMLSNGVPTGSGDSATKCALQVRFSSISTNETQLNTYNSIYYNEGSWSYLMGSDGDRLANDSIWNVELRVKPSQRAIDLIITDKNKARTATVNYSLTNSTSTASELWEDLKINNILFNTAVGTGTEMYVSDFQIFDFNESKDFNNGFNTIQEGLKLGNSSDLCGWKAEKMVETTNTYTPSLGSKLYADIKTQSNNKALHLYDMVDRTTSATNGAGGIIAYKKLYEYNSQYTLKYKLILGNAKDTAVTYSGISLTNSFVAGTSNQTSPCALQLRFTPVSGKVRIDTYNSVVFNEGGLTSFFVGDDAELFTLGVPWDVNLLVDTQYLTITVTISDGTITKTKTVAYNSANSSNTVKENWLINNINNIQFNTGAGGKMEMYIDDIQAGDTSSVLNPTDLDDLYVHIKAKGTNYAINMTDSSTLNLATRGAWQNQIWRIRGIEGVDTRYTLSNIGLAKYLTAGTTIKSGGAGAPYITDDIYKFDFVQDAEGYFTIVSKSSNNALTASGTSLIQRAVDNSNAQKWEIIIIAESAVRSVRKSSGFKALSSNIKKRYDEIFLSHFEVSRFYADEAEANFNTNTYKTKSATEQQTQINTNMKSTKWAGFGEVSTDPVATCQITINDPVWATNNPTWGGTWAWDTAGYVFNCTIVDASGAIHKFDINTDSSTGGLALSSVTAQNSYVLRIAKALASFPHYMRKKVQKINYRPSSANQYNAGGTGMWIRTNWDPNNIQGVSYMFAHELGHILDDNYASWDASGLWSAAITSDANCVSSYGNTNKNEDMAEFSRLYWQLNDKPQAAQGIKARYPNRWSRYEKILSAAQK